MTVSIDGVGNKHTNDNFSFTVDAKGGTNFEKESIFYIGTFTKISGLGTAPVSFGKWYTLKSDKDYVRSSHYNLIKEARNARADALLGDIGAMENRRTKCSSNTLTGLLPDKVRTKTWSIQLKATPKQPKW